MHIANLDDIRLHHRIDGDPDGAPVVFSNSLGTDLRLWDQIIPLLPKGLKFIRYDMRGHGLSDCPPAPYGMGALVSDVEKLMDHLGVRDAVFVGLSIGGMIAQGLAAKRLDLIRALVLSNTGARIGNRDMWQDRIDAVRAGGIEALSEATLQRWFSAAFRASDAFNGWRNMLIRQPVEGYIGCSAAISGTDFMTTTAALRLPTLGIAGSEDGSTPPDLVRETLDLIPGAEFALIRGAGHLPCVEQPEAYARILTDFITRQGHATL
ncbi:3-oxoadipate enol-lactonase [Puniceibacterium antarcticum]|uniref:3-oxoadipate enol-lactonase n=1 Tax=Puniceibacterium antarcticum TaxID=1206336 RepID=A0A2G8RGT2_9RHOB|nr:3-oxoadipate enol-lactonase [Puniceibacterium antarcticum]PIL20298.1 3-oxoadipate enol-lactonase [Puniceibacterium antarcticum]